MTAKEMANMRAKGASGKALRDLRSSCYSGFEIGDVTVGVEDSRGREVALSPSLQPFWAETENPDIAIRVEWLPDLPVDSGRQVFDSGCTWQLYEEDAGLRFDFCVPALGPQPYKRLLINQQYSRATLQMNEESLSRATSPLFPLTYPLDELLIMHRLTQERAIELHGCGIVRPDGTGNLFVGHSGAGKSTTTRLWTAREDVLVLSDDRIIVRRADSPVRIGHSARDDERKNGIRMYGTPWHGEAMYASPGSAPVARIFILEHGDGNVLTRLSSSQAIAELFARSFVPFHRHEYVESALQFLQEVAGAVPVYRYAFEPSQGAVETILNFHD